VLIRIKDDGALFRRNFNRNDLFLEFSFLDGFFRQLLASETKGVLVFPGHIVFFRHIFRGLAHGVPAQGIKEDQLVLELAMAQAIAPPGLFQHKGGIAHAFHAAGNDNISIPGFNDLGSQGHGLDTAGTGLADGELGFFNGNPGLDRHNPGGVDGKVPGPVTGCINNLIHLVPGNPPAFHDFFDGDGSEIYIAQWLECSSEFADGRSAGCNNNNFSHFSS